MSHLRPLITAAHSVFLLSVICISRHSVRINLTMTNSHCNNQKHYCRRYGPTESLDRWMKNQCLIMFLESFLSVLSSVSSPPSILLSSLIECMWSTVLSEDDKWDCCFGCPNVPIKNLRSELFHICHYGKKNVIVRFYTSKV